MIICKYFSLALLLIVAGLALGKSSHSQRDNVEDSDSNNLKIKSYFYLSMPLFLRNAIDAFTQAPPLTSTQSHSTTTKTHSTTFTELSSTHSNEQCNITSCLNGGTLQSIINNGSCPSCLCTQNCWGERCQTCSSYSTTTPSYNQKAFCFNEGVVVYDSNGGFRCNCLDGYQGNYCELIEECYFNSLNCNSGGKPSFDPTIGRCGCSCSACYYGLNCEFYNSNCNPSTPTYTVKPNCDIMHCKTGERIKVNSTDSDCKCACSVSYTGEYCELYNTIANQITCSNTGPPYYDPSTHTYKCACPPGRHGQHCEYIEKAYVSVIPVTGYTCETMPCFNNGAVVYGSNGTCWCNCSAPYQGEFCEYRRLCQDNICENGGSALYNPSTTRCDHCSCPACYYGSKCEYFDQNCNSSSAVTQRTTTRPSCSSLSCRAGMVIQLNDTSCECACNYGYAGEYCEFYHQFYDFFGCNFAGTPYYELTSQSFKCACLPGYYGAFCDYRLLN